MKELPGSLERFADLIFAISDRVVEIARSPSAEERRFNWDVDELNRLLLRLYERTSGKARDRIRKKCLDIWDSLFESRATFALALSKGFNSSDV